MPDAAPRACPRPGCRHAQPCPDHPPGRWAAGVPGRRMPPGWAATRRRILARDGWACRLALPGCTGHATEVDHAVPGAEDDATLRAACPACHARRTQAQAQAARGIPPR